MYLPIGNNKCYKMRLVTGIPNRYKCLLFIFLTIFIIVILTHKNLNKSKALLSYAPGLKCTDKVLKKSVEYRGKYIVFTNYVQANRKYKCNESITYSAPADCRFLDNILPIVDRWHGPISVALYAPGYDFFTTIQSIAYLRKCTTPLVKEYVTFHIFFDIKHTPEITNDRNLLDVYEDQFDCSKRPPYESLTSEDMYKQKTGLFYPINVARNVAKLNAQTHFVFPCDIELYPTRNFIPKFFDFMKKQPQYFKEDSKNVFVFPLFEILAQYTVPETKTELQEMLKNKTAFSFHAKLCPECHNTPKSKQWIKTNETEGLNIFTSSKRQGPQKVWEPFYVCTQKEPLWDERLNWEGQGNKMCQVYYMCILDYDFLVLDNAFLIHKPGVKEEILQRIKYKHQLVVNNKIRRYIQEELTKIYGIVNGSTSNCVVI